MTALTRILYVEDAPDIQVIAKLALESIGGYEVLMCSSGAAALAQAPAFKPQLLVLDVMMPNMSGPETLLALRELPNFSTQPAVFVTAKTQPDALAHYRQVGAVEVIEKPFDPLKLAAQLQEVFNRYASH
ncbi:response regulator [Salinibius halmophilus]|uniref:response regulator n=1 Tax=Salinibius halmophilus TaxID=1853216 RepID=UPI000E6615CB|nr:response regulator [Salinibius halmophilus]